MSKAVLLKITLWLLFTAVQLDGFGQEIVRIKDTTIQRSDKEAILVLSGLGDSKKARKHQLAFFGKTNYDVFIPLYIQREGFDSSASYFAHFFAEQHLGEYKHVHIFSYIMGSWTINTFIRKHHPTNIETIVYDRSPLQERAPQVIVDRIPRIGRLLKGNTVEDLSKIDYPSIPKEGIRMGIIVESKATKLIKFFKKTAMGYGGIDWDNLNFNQATDDLMFCRLDHAQMYHSFDVIGADILHFIEHGTFTENAKRTPYTKDPFKRGK